MSPPAPPPDRDAESPAGAPPAEVNLRNLRLRIEYDGTDFAGWQRQIGQRTVQGCLEAAFRTMVGETVVIRGAGRTDAGVHALGQVANVHVAAKVPVGGFLRGLNAHLPPDIAVLDVSDVPASFDARRAARGKLYRYRIWNHLVRSPLYARTTWHCRAPLDVEALRETAALFVGEHDFRGFRAADCERVSTVRLIRRFDVERHGAVLTFEVEGTAFLKNMVRILAGTLVGVGRGELGLDTVRGVLQSGDRTQAGVTAPACGLTLVHVTY